MFAYFSTFCDNLGNNKYYENWIVGLFRRGVEDNISVVSGDENKDMML